MVKKLSVWSGEHWLGQKRLIFIRGALTNGAKVASERWNVRKLFFCSNSYVSRSSGKKEKAWRFICPYLSKGPKYAGSYRFNIEMKRKLSQWQWKWKQKLKASSTAWYGGSWKWKVESALFCILPWQLMRESTCPLHKESTFNRLTSKLNAYWQFDILSSCYSLISWFFSFWGYFECFNKWNDADTAIVTYIIP